MQGPVELCELVTVKVLIRFEAFSGKHPGKLADDGVEEAYDCRVSMG